MTGCAANLEGSFEDLSGDIQLRSGDGGVTARELHGRISARTGDGPIRIDGVFYEMNLATGDGSIVAVAERGSKMGDGWSVHTGDGSVLLKIPSDLAADLDAHTGDGHISFDFPIEIALHTDVAVTVTVSVLGEQ